MSAAVQSLAKSYAAPRPDFPNNRAGKHRLSPLTQALDLKDIAYHDAHDPKTPPHIKAALMRAWVDLQEVVMSIRGQGKPKPIEARNARPRQRGQSVTPVSEKLAA
jgi:hypothetical protein